MTVRQTKMGVATYLSPDASLVEDQVPSLQKAVQDVRDTGGANIVVDLKRVPFIDSRGLEYLWDLSTDLSSRGGSLRIACANATCKEILRITRVDQTIPVFEDLESAGRSFI